MSSVSVMSATVSLTRKSSQSQSVRVRLLRDLRDLERLGLLGGVGVFRTRVHLQLLDDLTPQLVVGDHALDRVLDRAARVLREQVGVRRGAQTARVAGVAVLLL